jgi:hypothetical protein
MENQVEEAIAFEVKRLHQEGKSIRDIVKELDISKWKVEQYIKEEPPVKKKSKLVVKPPIRWYLTRSGLHQTLYYLSCRTVPPDSEDDIQLKMYLLMLYTFHQGQLEVCKQWGYSFETWVNPAKEVIKGIEQHFKENEIGVDWNPVINQLEDWKLIEGWK